ncbi:MAG TPA: UbiX family flavin prenyltransferase [Firmicutes bacterium]|jgi:4-hydroxy-3-polyprenylbenzoate decarboxylase|nr:UbiX family flavin prenyltransferase [Bacillota bacterium]
MVKIIVGISGATGAIYGIRTLETLSRLNIESHLIITGAGKRTIELESDYNPEDVEKMASKVYHIDDIAAPISSGSFRTDGMLIAPCSIKSLSAIANSFNTNLLVRAADVALKEKRKLVLLIRETPLHLGHLRLMTTVAEMGGILLPPMPAFYNFPQTIDDLVNQSVGKALDQFALDHNLFQRWRGSAFAGKQKKEKWLGMTK